jgi:hypothetical protein
MSINECHSAMNHGLYDMARNILKKIDKSKENEIILAFAFT